MGAAMRKRWIVLAGLVVVAAVVSRAWAETSEENLRRLNGYDEAPTRHSG
jgi:predicted lysophospholipase L1 biosynthesis ABC-type transport system permease subunit